MHCAGGILEGDMSTCNVQMAEVNLRGRLEYHITSRDKWRPEGKMTAEDNYVVLSSGLAPDCPGLRGGEKPEIYEIGENKEARRNKDDSLW